MQFHQDNEPHRKTKKMMVKMYKLHSEKLQASAPTVPSESGFLFFLILNNHVFNTELLQKLKLQGVFGKK